MEEKKITNPVKAIRAKCLDCCCGSSNEVELCTCTGCALYPFRRGKNPYRAKREITPEHAEKLRTGRMTKTVTISEEKNANPFRGINTLPDAVCPKNH